MDILQDISLQSVTRQDRDREKKHEEKKREEKEREEKERQKKQRQTAFYLSFLIKDSKGQKEEEERKRKEEQKRKEEEEEEKRSYIRTLRATANSLVNSDRPEIDPVDIVPNDNGDPRMDLSRQLNKFFAQSCLSKPSMNVVFFSKKRWKEISNNYTLRTEVFNILKLDVALHAYLVSSRSGWHYVSSNEQYSFMIKDYLYMLAWTFDRTTLATRAIFTARDDYEGQSSLKGQDGRFNLPGLRVMHLYHPLSLACICLADFAFYFDNLIVDEGYRIGDIERDTGHGLWVEEKTNAPAPELPKLMNASRDIAKIIVIFANLFKSVEVANTIVDSLQHDDSWEKWYKKCRKDTKSLMHFDQCNTSFRPAIELLRLRIKTIKQSGQVIDERAKAQSTVVGDLIRREDAAAGYRLAEATKKDSSDMKVIAIMTMLFLPATFFAALFAIPTLDWHQENVITENFRIYLAFALPTTFVIFVTWDLLNEHKIFKLIHKIYQWLDKNETKKESHDSQRKRSSGESMV